ncbi:MAG: hypothetical protein AAB638_04100 [Patescibacteria group bacterium]
MKLLGLLFLLTINISAVGQRENEKQSIKTIEQIFNSYIKQKENSDSEDNRIKMELSLKSLETKCDSKYLPTLIEVWMYYDPTDFPTRKFVLPILLRDKSEGLRAIEKRIKEKKKWETNDTAPFSDLLSLRDELKKM